ncbi:MAG: hypothetical protein RL417_1112 [Pseudomonadota bacterium]
MGSDKLSVARYKSESRGGKARPSKEKLPAWDLSDLYRDLEDPAIERDMRSGERAARTFQKRYKGKLGKLITSGPRLAEALTEYETIHEGLGIPGSYAYLRYAEAPADGARGAFLQKINARTVAISQDLLFFELELAALPEKKLRSFSRAPAMKRLRHYVDKVLLYKPHRLSEPEERLLDERNLTGRAAFNRLFDQEHAELRYPVKRRGKVESLSGTQTLELLQSPDRRVRQAAAEGLTAGLTTRARLNTFVFNTLYEDKRVEDKYRHFPQPETARHLSNETTAAMVDTMADVVRSSYPLVQRYYRLKSKVLGLKRLYDYDRYAPLGKGASRTFSYAEAQELVLVAFERFAPGYRRLAERFFDRNWIDAAPRPGKRGGAFCHPVTPSKHPYVLTNYSGSLRDVLTLAHELGHAIHFVLMAPQGYLNTDVPLTVAETASVFSEMLVFDFMKRELKEGELFTLMAGKVESIFSTVHRQIAMFTFEQGLHRARRDTGEVSTEGINRIWRETQTAMFGKAVELSPGYDLWWSYIPHFIHSPFYVYAYAFGELLTLALYEQYVQGRPRFVEHYLDILGAGASADPQTIVTPLGINLSKRTFWQGGIDVIARMVEELEQMSRRRGRA